jgi:3-dehydroquinate synthase
MDVTLNWEGRTRVDFLPNLPTASRIAEALGFTPGKTLVIYDKRLRKRPDVKRWLGAFDLTYAVEGGEKLKDFAEFPAHLKKMTNLLRAFSPRASAIVALGGGSVGDFAAFTASILKRGVPLVHVPTTLLAALDSAHGGKTALNLGGIKNQVGSFYPAAAVLIARPLFGDLPIEQLRSAAGELAKMALLAGGTLFDAVRADLKPDLDVIWRHLPAAIEAKYDVVKRDPLEHAGERQILNLGHSLGHALESYHHLPHGVAVGQGVIFALRWSAHQGYFRGGRAEELITWMTDALGLLDPREYAKKYRPMSRAKLERLLKQDKKMTDAHHVSFIFLENVGRPLRKTIPIESLLTETQRQGWTAV